MTRREPDIEVVEVELDSEQQAVGNADWGMMWYRGLIVARVVQSLANTKAGRCRRLQFA
jgi:hypothetical protein